MPRRYVYQKIVGGGIPIKFEFLHGVSFAFYFEDPEGNVIEVFWPTGLEYPQPFAQNCEIDKRSIEAMGEVLAATNRSLIVAGGLGGLSAPGQIATENNVPSPDFPFPRCFRTDGGGAVGEGRELRRDASSPGSEHSLSSALVR